MLWGLHIRADERREAWAGFATLFTVVGSHAVLETARDALFLASIPASRLPWVFIAIAVMSLAVTRLQQWLSPGLNQRAALALWSVVASGVALYFWIAGTSDTVSLYILYVWSGVVTTLMLIHFWTLLGDRFTVTQAKRLYGFIGAGSVTGAIVGSGLAGGLASVIEPHHLLLVAAAGFGLAAITTLAMRSRDGGERRTSDTLDTTFGETISYVVRQPYTRRIALVLVTAAATLTVADFLFKSAIAEHVPKEQFATYFATVSFVLNLASLVIQLGAVSWVLRRFSVAAALAVLPLLLVAGASWLAATGGLLGALLIKGADGSLRYSLHRTAAEFLYVPLGENARHRVKAFVDVIGQRGGQTLASVGILAGGALAVSTQALSVVLIVLALLWIVSATAVRTPYLDLLRLRLRRRRAASSNEFPELDVASLENLIAALDSPNDAMVLASLRVLHQEDKLRLIPGLLLYHPSDDIVVYTLDLFTDARRTQVVPIINRLLGHGSPRVRAAAIAAKSVLEPNEQELRMRLSHEESPEVRATIMVNLIASGAIVGSDARDALNGFLDHGSAQTRIALAEAIGRRRARGFEDTIIRIAGDLDPAVRKASLETIGQLGSEQFLPTLIGFLGDEHTRPDARGILLEYGDKGLHALEQALNDASLERVLRWQLPKSIAMFEPREAASILLKNLPDEVDGMVRYRSIRGLEHLVKRSPRVALDKGLLDKVINDTVGRAYRYLDRVSILKRGRELEPRRATAGCALLVAMLDDKRAHAIDRIFRLLGLRYRRENFVQIYRGLSSDRPKTRASSVELLENILPMPLRTGVVALVDDLDDHRRQELGRGFHQPLQVDYDGLLELMMKSSSDAVQDVTIFHIGELGIERFRDRLHALPDDVRSRPDVARVLAAMNPRAGLESPVAL